MDRHVEVVGFEGVGHLSEGAQRVVSVRLLKAKGLLRFAALLGRNEGWGLRKGVSHLHNVITLIRRDAQQ